MHSISMETLTFIAMCNVAIETSNTMLLLIALLPFVAKNLSKSDIAMEVISLDKSK